MTSISFTDASKKYGHTLVIDNLDLAVRSGEFLALLGPSGSGKTTLLRTIAGLERLSRGTLRIDDLVVDDPATGVNVPPNRRGLGLVFQSYALWPHLNVFDNIAFPLRARKVQRPAVAAAVSKALETVGLHELATRKIQQLSGGQQQRVALARAIVANPRVLLLDEPLSNLDTRLRERLRGELRRVHDQIETTTILVTHDQGEALSLADRVVVINHGVIEQEGTPVELFAYPATRFVADFLGYQTFLTASVVRTHGESLTVRSAEWGGEIAVARSTLDSGVGDQIVLAVRPSAITLSSGPADSSGGPDVSSSSGVVLENHFEGVHRDYRIRVAGGAEITARSVDDFPVGAAVGVHLPATGVVPVTDHPSTVGSTAA